MYNRYIPQSDGSYRKNRVPEPARQDSHATPKTEHQKKTEQKPFVPCPSHGGSVPGFLKNLLPKEFDTGDLLIVLLLLLMAERCEDDRNTALLTLALYFFL